MLEAADAAAWTSSVTPAQQRTLGLNDDHS